MFIVQLSIPNLDFYEGEVYYCDKRCLVADRYRNVCPYATKFVQCHARGHNGGGTLSTRRHDCHHSHKNH